MKLDFSKITEKTAVWCDTQEKAKEFVKQGGYLGYIIHPSQYASEYYIYEDKTCYIINSDFISIRTFKDFKDGYYTLIPFNDLIIKDDKQIADYTIKEWQEHCKNYGNNDNCLDTCDMKKLCKPLYNSKTIVEIDLSEKPKFTSNEIDKLKAIRLIFPNHTKIYKINNDTIQIISSEVCDIVIYENEFLTLKQGETINIDEILKEYENEMV